MDEPGYTEADIHVHATPQSFERGLQYLHSGAVRRMVRRGDQVLARVEGGHYRPYKVRIRLKGAAIREARCDCPYEWGGWCKHIVAVLLAMLYQPERVKERAAIESLLDDLSPEQLRQLILDLSDRYPRLIARIERWVNSSRSADSA